MVNDQCFLDSPYRTLISQTVLKMQEEGKLHRLKTKWWKEKDKNNGNLIRLKEST